MTYYSKYDHSNWAFPLRQAAQLTVQQNGRVMSVRRFMQKYAESNTFDYLKMINNQLMTKD